jgi:hypothetical protein
MTMPKRKARSGSGQRFPGDKHEIEAILLTILPETLIYIKDDPCLCRLLDGCLAMSAMQRKQAAHGFRCYSSAWY